MLKTGFEYKYYLFSFIYTIHIVYLHCTSTLIAPDSFIGAVYKLTLVSNKNGRVKKLIK